MTGLEIGAVVADRYEVRGETMVGPAYTDFRVFDREIEVELALWWMDPRLYGDETPRAALESGARAVRALSHRNVRRLFDVGDSGNGLFVVLQLASPDRLLRSVQGGERAADLDVLRYATGLCEGLEAAHAAGFVHGRLVPADIVDVSGQIKISGIGLYRGLDPARVAERWGESFRYLAPEVIASGAATPRSDVYSLAAILAEMAAGLAHPDLRQTLDALGGDHPALAEVLERGVSRAPERRPGRPAELVGLIRRLFVDERVPMTRPDVSPAPEETPTTLPRYNPEEDEDGIGDKTIEESSPLFKDPSAAPKSPLFGPNAPTLLGRRTMASRPPGAAPPAQPAAEPDSSAMETVIDRSSPGPLVVPVQSHKVASPPKATPLVSAIDRPELQPVLRPISSVKKPPSPPPGALGNYAPPVKPSPAPPPRRRWPWVLLFAMILAAGAGLAIGIAVTRDKKKAAPPPPVPVVTPVPPCPKEMLLVESRLAASSKKAFCVDRHEAPGAGRAPETGHTRDDAEAACRSRGARLCTQEEWDDACRGPEGAAFPYGTAYVARKCNTRGREVAPAGSFPECMSATGAIDMSGNAAEWDSSGAVRGASALDGTRGRCSDRRALSPASPLSDVGFRCCADSLAPVGPDR
jgi:serine/threonine protein kinase